MIFNVICILIGILVSFIATVFCNILKASEKQKFCFIASISALAYFVISFIGVFIEDLDLRLLTQAFLYCASIYMLIGFMMTINHVLGNDMTDKFKGIVGIISLFFVLIIVTCSSLPSWYMKASTVLAQGTNYYALNIEGGWLYYLVNVIGILLIIAWVVLTIVKHCLRKKYRLTLFKYLAIFILGPLFVWCLAASKIVPSSLMCEILFVFFILLVLYAIIFFNMTHNKGSKNDALIESSVYAIVVLDYKKRYLYSNKRAKELFDIIKKDNPDAITAFINVNLIDENTYFDGNTNYNIKINEISDDRNPRIGYALWIIEKD